MQKKLIALAIAGLSSTAFAQSNVTISGLLDMGFYGQSMGTSTIMDSKSYAAANGSSTSNVTFAGSEDLGGGMKAGFVLTNDLAAGAHNASGFMQGQTYLELASTKWGSMKMGNVNTAGLVATMTMQPFGTGIGSGISGAFGRLSRVGTNGNGATANTATAGLMGEGEQTGTAATGIHAGMSGARSVRVNNSFSYTSPNFSGFSASLQFAAKNGDANVAAAGNNPGFTGIGLAYNNGPANVAFVQETYTQVTGAAAAAGTGGLGFALGAGEKVTHNMLGGNYTFGPATVYAGWTSSKSSVAATSDARSWNLALKYAFTGALSGGINVVKYDDKLILNQDRSLTSLGLDYAMSKRTTAYGRYETGDNDKSVATGKFNRYQVGVRHSF